jgi:hypothetical protein
MINTERARHVVIMGLLQASSLTATMFVHLAITTFCGRTGTAVFLLAFVLFT